jgi:hypothetical protein
MHRHGFVDDATFGTIGTRTAMFFENVLTGDKDCVLLEVNAIDLANTAFGFAVDDSGFYSFFGESCPKRTSLVRESPRQVKRTLTRAGLGARPASPGQVRRL